MSVVSQPRQQIQQGDVRLLYPADGGEICIEGGLTEMNGGLESAVNISLFSGQWWGNAIETDPDRLITSRTLEVLTGLPATSANLQSVRRAVESDLGWMVSLGVATAIEVETSLVARNRLSLTVGITTEEDQESFTYELNWRLR